MKTIPMKDPGTSHFCMVYPGFENRSKSEIIEEKEIIRFEDPDTRDSFMAKRMDMLWYPLNEVSDFHARACLQMTATELQKYMQQNYGSKETDEVWILLFSKI